MASPPSADPAPSSVAGSRAAGLVAPHEVVSPLLLWRDEGLKPEVGEGSAAGNPDGADEGDSLATSRESQGLSVDAQGDGLSDNALQELLGFGPRWFILVGAVCVSLLGMRVCREAIILHSERPHGEWLLFGVFAGMRVLDASANYMALKFVRSDLFADVLRAALDQELHEGQVTAIERLWRFRGCVSKLVKAFAPCTCIYILVELFELHWAWRSPTDSVADRSRHLSIAQKGLVIWLHAMDLLGCLAPPLALLVNVWQLCLARIFVIIDRLEDGSLAADWAAACQEADALDQDLGAVWSFSGAGGLWVLVMLRCVGTLVMLVLAPKALATVFGFNDALHVMAVPYIIECVAVVVGILFLVASVSQLTARCSSTLTAQRSVLNAARGCFGRCASMSSTERLQYHNFMAHLTSKTRGVELGGVLLMTVERSAMMLLQILLHSPVIYAILCKFASLSRAYE